MNIDIDVIFSWGTMTDVSALWDRKKSWLYVNWWKEVFEMGTCYLIKIDQTIGEPIRLWKGQSPTEVAIPKTGTEPDYLRAKFRPGVISQEESKIFKEGIIIYLDFLVILYFHFSKYLQLSIIRSVNLSSIPSSLTSCVPQHDIRGARGYFDAYTFAPQFYFPPGYPSGNKLNARKRLKLRWYLLNSFRGSGLTEPAGSWVTGSDILHEFSASMGLLNPVILYLVRSPLVSVREFVGREFIRVCLTPYPLWHLRQPLVAAEKPTGCCCDPPLMLLRHPLLAAAIPLSCCCDTSQLLLHYSPL